MDSSSFSSMDRVIFRTQVLTRHLKSHHNAATDLLHTAPCVSYSPPELSEPPLNFNTKMLRELLDGQNIADIDYMFNLMMQSNLFCPRERGGKVFVAPDFNQSMEQQREMAMRRIDYFREQGVFDGWFSKKGPEAELWRFAVAETASVFDHSLAIKLGVHFFLWGGAIRFMGTKRHHDKWYKPTETYEVKGCFAMTELGHGSNVRGIETITRYDPSTQEFIISTPCESAQKYWIGGAANHATHTVVFSQLEINGVNQGVHAFIAQIRDSEGNICPNVRIADCGHKIGLNGVDNGRIWFDNLRIPRENLLNSVADVSPDGEYLSAIKDPDQRFAAFLAPLTSGRVTIAASAINTAKVGLAVAVRYSLTRRAFSIKANEPEVLLLDYPSHQRRLLPLVAKTYALNFASNYLKMIYVKRTPESIKTVHVVSSALKAALTWHCMRTLQECREACGGQGLKTENHVGHLKSEYDVQLTFEGDNNVLMQQISKALYAEFLSAKKRNKPIRGLGLEHLNNPAPVIPSHLTSSTLRTTQFQTDIFCLRERDLLQRFVTEVSQHQAQGESREHIFTVMYQLAEDLGRAFADRLVLQTFLDVEATVPSGSLKDVLGLMRSMYSTIVLEEDSSFLRYGYLSVDNAAVVRKEVLKLCSELRPHALGLVSSFGIPDAFLGPIAFNWVDANAWSSV
ncbi:acyl-coenzyme A oxidase 3, peroxisomal isoform X2 [Lactuca sativa]|uniref:acyl-coenzyme A oxidase 3, peroxisomal isoform X2 n=1 Tax=Lactuca sativa TaxID=4236 RepID=UPI000CD8C273|nr:acyl-coenzyme A oxidase 3, peroxisomal isoform X2 [Lactuca sativa]